MIDVTLAEIEAVAELAAELAHEPPSPLRDEVARDLIGLCGGNVAVARLVLHEALDRLA